MDENLQGLLLILGVLSCLCCIIESTRDCEKCLTPESISPEKQEIYESKKIYSDKFHNDLEVGREFKRKIFINNEYVELNDIKILN
jgi:hypothetical protein